MSRSLLKLALLGGFVVFAWGMLSWMILPLHRSCFLQFQDEGRVAEVIKENAPEAGVYLLPNTVHYDENSSPAAIRKAVRLMDNGPFMFATVVPQGLGRQVGGPLFFSIVTQMLGAFIVSWMLSLTRGLLFWNQVWFVTLFGLAVGMLGFLPFWNWLGFPGSYVLLNIFDVTIGWFLAGLVIAKTSSL